MNGYSVSEGARADLDEIWFYIAQDNPGAADKFIRAMISRFSKLASMPQMGRPHGELLPRLRSFPLGNHVIF